MRHPVAWLAGLVIVLGGFQPVEADVTGLFNLDLSLTPQTNTQEAVQFDFDIQSNLQTHITLSGLTVSVDRGLGITGLEFAVLAVSTNLGALSLKDEFVFAQPFGCSEPTWLGVVGGLSDNSDGGIVGQCPGPFVIPIGSSDGTTNDAAVGFVKKRVNMALDLAGISVGVLALFEDVDFPDIHGATSEDLIGDPKGSDHEHDHFRAGDLYFVGAADTVLDNQTPTYGFGAVFTIGGQTISGISVTNITGVCADPQVKNRIKKRSFAGEVDLACVNDTGPSLAFTVEKIHVEGVELGGLSWDFWLEFRPGEPTQLITNLAFSLASLAEVQAKFQVNDLLTLMVDEITLSLVADNFTLVVEDLNADLQFDRTTATLNVVLNPNQNPASFTSVTVGENGVGLTSQTFELSVTRSGLTLTLLTQLLHNGTNLAWDRTTFTASAQANILTVGANVTFSTQGLGTSAINLGATF